MKHNLASPRERSFPRATGHNYEPFFPIHEMEYCFTKHLICKSVPQGGTTSSGCFLDGESLNPQDYYILSIVFLSNPWVTVNRDKDASDSITQPIERG